MGDKNPKPVKKIKSKTPIPYEYYKMTSIGPNDRELFPPEKFREMMISKMTNMNEKDIEYMADVIIHLIEQLRELYKSNKKNSVQSERSDLQN